MPFTRPSPDTTPAPPVKIVVAVRNRCLYDTLAQILGRVSPPPDLVRAASPADICAAVAERPALIVADPFALLEAHALHELHTLKRCAGVTPLLALLPADTREYRDVAVRLGANGVVVVERSATDLLPAVERLLQPAPLVDGVARRISSTAWHSAPAGEAAYFEASGDLSHLENLTRRTVEALDPALGIAGALPISDTGSLSPDGGRMFLRGLTLTAAAPSGTEGQPWHARTACNLNCGAHFCGLDVTVRDGQIVKIEPADFPDDRYRRVCLKGISYVQMVAHPDRLTHPLKRIGPRGEGRWERISWERALDEIAARLQRTIDAHGAESLMFFPYSGQLSALNGMSGVYLRLASLLGASATDLNQFGLDSAVPSGIQDTFGTGTGYLANDYADLPNSRLVLIWGANPVHSRMNWWPFFLDAKRSGTALITIDPRYSATAAKSDAWLPIRPGADLYLALALLNVIVARDWIDREAVLGHTVAPLLVRDDDGRYLRGAGDSPLAWDEAQARAVPAAAARQPALSGVYSVKGVTCRPAYALLRDMLAPYTPDAVADKVGLGAARIVELAYRYATTKPARIFTLYGIDRWHHGATFGRLIATLAALTGNVGLPGGGAGVDGFCEGALFVSDFTYPDGKAYRPLNPAGLPGQILSGHPHPIKAVVVAFNNWLNQWPDQTRMCQDVLPRLDLLVTADHFMTETARWSDYVLPAAMLFEREDMVKGPGPFVQYQPPIVPPPGECRSDLAIAAGLAERLGLGDYFARPPIEYLDEVLASSGPETAGLSALDLRERGVLRKNVPDAPPVAHAGGRFPTPTGRIEFYVERLLPYGCALPDYEPPVEAHPGGRLARRFPLVCLTEHSRYRVHSTFGNVPWLRELDREPEALLHPSEARSRGIANGDLVRIFNDRGYVVLRARLSQAAPPGAVYLTQGWQSRDFLEGHPQSLTHDRVNPANALGPNCSFSDVLVEIAKERYEHVPR